MCKTESQCGKCQSGTDKWYVIDRIVEHRDIDGQREYKVRWKGYDENEDQQECLKFTNESDTFLKQILCDNRPA